MGGKTMLYSCMLVDDEEDVISAIRQTIDWESLGFSVPREAHNGIEALEFAEESAPDVVLTDIKMPYMDGLELAHKLKELYPNLRIVVFSGFDEFEYAREALRLEAEEYMLKPVHAAELSKLFLRIRESLEAVLSPLYFSSRNHAGSSERGGRSFQMASIKSSW